MARLAKALPGFDVAEALDRIDGNIALFKELLEDFYNSLVAALPVLRPLIQGGGIQEALNRLHGLKGVSANLGAGSLNQALWTLEQALATSRQDQYEILVTRVEHAIQHNIAAIEACLDAETPPQPDPPPPEEANEELLIESMSLLARLLDEGRLDAADGLMRLKNLLDNRRPHLEFDNLDAAIRCLDYAAARKALTVLAASMNIVL